MYDDRLEVTSSGTLHFGLTPQALFEPHESRPWNPLIASVFFRRGIIETWGQGTLKMAAWAEEAGLPRPEILEIPGAVVVRFRRTPMIPQRLAGPELTARQQAILDALGPGELVAISEIMGRLGESHPRRTIQFDLTNLKGLGLVEVVGKGRNTRWRRTR
jgi:ATP-dependent DNA helicase RecG